MHWVISLLDTPQSDLLKAVTSGGLHLSLLTPINTQKFHKYKKNCRATRKDYTKLYRYTPECNFIWKTYPAIRIEIKKKLLNWNIKYASYCIIKRVKTQELQKLELTPWGYMYLPTNQVTSWAVVVTVSLTSNLQNRISSSASPTWRLCQIWVNSLKGFLTYCEKT